jgi:7-cyano-7-deazaguanine synthase
MSLAIVSLSGGMDSCVVASIAKHDGHELAFLHAEYGQLTEARERMAFQQIADYYDVPQNRRLVVPMQGLKLIGGSALTDASIPMDCGELEHKAIPNTYVPFRNAHLLSACVSWAECLGARHIFVGILEGDSSGYPDCRKSFLKAFEHAANEGTLPETAIFIHAPLIDKSKGEIVKIGMSIQAPFHLTWSCYRSGALACGTCASCILRLKGFRLAGCKDPINYVHCAEGEI